MTRERSDGGRSRRAVLAGAGAGAVGLFGLAGSGGAAPERASERDGWTENPPPVAERFVEATTSEATTSNPVTIGDTATANRLDKLYDGGGGRFGPETFDPRWMASWELSDDNRVVEYTLRDGLEWGGPYGQLTAEDYVYILTELVVPEENRRWFPHPDREEYLLGEARDRIRYEKTGPLSFRAELPVAKPQWLHEDPLFELIPLPRSLLERYVPDQNADGIRSDSDATDGTLSEGNLGPYTFEEWERGSRWVYRRNDDYYMRDHADEDPFVGDPYYDFRDAPYFEEYHVEVFDAPRTAQSRLLNGEVDATDLSTETVEGVRGATEVDVWENGYANGVFWLNFNHRINGWAPIRESREVRRAMTNLYDSTTLVERAYKGNAHPTATFHPSWGPYYPEEEDLYVPAGTVEEAKSLLASGTSSDYGYADDGTFRGPDGSQVSLTAVRSAGNVTVEVAASYTADRLAEAGIELDVETRNWSSLLRNYAINSPANVDGVDEPDWSLGAYNGGPWDQSASAEDWDLMFGLGFEANPYAPWDTVETAMAEKGAFNLWGYHQGEMDVRQQLEDAATASDRVDTYQRMMELFGFLSRDVALGWTSTEVAATGYSDRIGGLPGESEPWGARANSKFHQPDPARLLRVTDETVAGGGSTTERPTTEPTTERPTTEPTTEPPTPTVQPTTGTPSTTGAPDGADDTPTATGDGTDADVEFGDDEDGSVPGFDALAALGGVAGLAEYARRRGGDEGDGEG